MLASVTREDVYYQHEYRCPTHALNSRRGNNAVGSVVQAGRLASQSASVPEIKCIFIVCLGN